MMIHIYTRIKGVAYIGWVKAKLGGKAKEDICRKPIEKSEERKEAAAKISILMIKEEII